MKTVIIACETIRQELLAAVERTGCSFEILWLESGLHNWPKKLQGRIRELLDRCGEYDTVLLAMSFCGNSVVGLQTRAFQLVIPRCDDCITLLLGSLSRRLEVKGSYFLTEGWLRGERNIWKEYCHCISRYGQERGREIFEDLLSHYEKLTLVDTGCSDREALEGEVRQIADTLELEYSCMAGTLDHLSQLLTGPWTPERFVLVPPETTVTMEMCSLTGPFC